MTAQTPLKIDFVSDVMCPWCAVGLGELSKALETLSPEGIGADITFQPFELNPQMPPEGENIVDHIQKKYGSTPEQSAANRAMIRERASGVGFEINMSDAARMWNTFDAHRLLHWTHETAPEKQEALKRELFTAHFTRGLNVSDAGVLAASAEAAGLDRGEAAEVLASTRYTHEVRAAQQLWQSRGITSVPAVIVNEKYLISGGQPAQVFENALRQIAQETTTQASA